MASRRLDQLENSDFQVLRLIGGYPDVGTRKIAETIGISNGAAYYWFNALVRKGLVKLGNFTAASNKRKYTFVWTPQGLTEKTCPTTKFLRRKRKKYDALKLEIENLKEVPVEDVAVRQNPLRGETESDHLTDHDKTDA